MFNNSFFLMTCLISPIINDQRISFFLIHWSYGTVTEHKFDGNWIYDAEGVGSLSQLLHSSG